MPDPHTPYGPEGIYILPAADREKISKKIVDIAYADSSEFQKLDLYFPDMLQPVSGFPLIIFIHGGAWMMCDKSDIQVESAFTALDEGYAVASINYRLSSEAIFPAQIYDVKGAIRWLRAHKKEFGLNTDKIILWGASAGAHLASLAGTSSGINELEDLSMGSPGESSAVHVVVSWFGPTDFLLMDHYLTESGAGVPDHSAGDSPESILLGGRITENPDLVKMANPETWIRDNCPHFLLEHGDIDEIVPCQMSVYFTEKINQIAGAGRAELKILKGALHADSAFNRKENLAYVLKFIDKHIKEISII